MLSWGGPAVSLHSKSFPRIPVEGLGGAETRDGDVVIVRARDDEPGVKAKAGGEGKVGGAHRSALVNPPRVGARDRGTSLPRNQVGSGALH